MSRENHVGGGFPAARVRVDVGADAVPGLAGNQIAAVCCLADDFVAGRKVGDDEGARLGVVGGGRDRYPEILANFDREGDVRIGPVAKQQPRSEGNRRGAKPAGGNRVWFARLVRRGAKVAELVKLAVVRYMGFRNHAHDGAGGNHGRAVVTLGSGRVGEADDDNRRQVGSGFGDARHRARRGLAQRVLGEEVAASVGGHAQLGKDGEGSSPSGGLAGQGENRVDVRVDVTNRAVGRGRGHAQKTVCHTAIVYKNFPNRYTFSHYEQSA